MSIRKVELRHKNVLTKLFKDTIMCRKETESEVRKKWKAQANFPESS
nr:MAG TPA: hypothetical protein [Caudoviricetes sp.]